MRIRIFVHLIGVVLCTSMLASTSLAAPTDPEVVPDTIGLVKVDLVGCLSAKSAQLGGIPGPGEHRVVRVCDAAGTIPFVGVEGVFGPAVAKFL